MVRSAPSKVAWVGRTACTVFGLAPVMALVLRVGDPRPVRAVRVAENGLGKSRAARVYGIGLPSVGRQRRVRRSRSTARPPFLGLGRGVGMATRHIYGVTGPPHTKTVDRDGARRRRCARQRV